MKFTLFYRNKYCSKTTHQKNLKLLMMPNSRRLSIQVEILTLTVATRITQRNRSQVFYVKQANKGILTGHGVRAIPLTAGQEVFNFSSDIIQQQMAHAIGDKVHQAYDRAQFMKERKKFMTAWCDALVEQGLII